MAFPTIPTVAAGRVLTVNQLNTTATRTFPNLSSLTKNAGDLLIAIIVAYQSSTTNAQFGSWGAGFTEIHDSGSSTTLAVGIAYKWSTGSESGTFTVTQSATITGDASMILLSIPGAHPSTPPEVGGRVSGTSAAANPAAFNPSGWDVEDTLWISIVGSGMTSGTGSWTATGTTAPSNYNNRADTNASDTSTIGDVEAAVAFRQLAAASEDVGTAGVDTSNARNAAVVVAVRPAAPPNEGSASGTVDWTGVVVGVTVHNGNTAGSVTWTGTVTGSTTRVGEPSGSSIWDGSVTGATIHAGSATGISEWAGATTGTTIHEGSTTGTVTLAGTASGESPTVGAQEGTADGVLTWTGTVTGAVNHEGSTTGLLEWAGTVTGSSSVQPPPRRWLEAHGFSYGWKGR